MIPLFSTLSKGFMFVRWCRCIRSSSLGSFLSVCVFCLFVLFCARLGLSSSGVFCRFVLICSRLEYSSSVPPARYCLL